MTKISIKKMFKFEASHRLLGHPSKCINIHGHNYFVQIYVTSMDLDELGMVIDFSDLKKGIGKWLNDNWDHAIIYKKDDKEICNMFKNTKFKQFQMEGNPTAENMAIHLLDICDRLYENDNVSVFKVEVYENLESIAIAEKIS